VKMYLPRVDAPADASERPGVASATLSGTETVLVAEDEQRVLRLVAKTLRQKGYTVIEARGGVEALAICRAHEGPIDLLVTDVVMPKLGGRELAAAIKAYRPQIKTLFMSGYAENSIVHHGVLEDGISFLAKPFTPDTMALKVRAVLDGPADVRQGDHDE
jgi:two-component system cell cycle sensor histidine kinase/response regulator CckA